MGLAQIEVTTEIAAPPGSVWEMVADVTRMHEWSPEHEGATWRRGATHAVVGATFTGTNRNGPRSWSTTGRIVAADPGTRLAFQVTASGLKVAEWRYDLVPTATGCRVTETWIDRRNALTKLVGRVVTGVEERDEHNRASMASTLAELKAAAEAGHPQP